MTAKRVNENVHFRLFHMPCCHILICHVNHRLPNYCSECGARVYQKLKPLPPELVLIDDQGAWLSYSETVKDQLRASVKVISRGN